MEEEEEEPPPMTRASGNTSAHPNSAEKEGEEEEEKKKKKKKKTAKKQRKRDPQCSRRPPVPREHRHLTPAQVEHTRNNTSENPAIKKLRAELRAQSRWYPFMMSKHTRIRHRRWGDEARQPAATQQQREIGLSC